MKKLTIVLFIIGGLAYCLYAQSGPIQPIITNLTQFKNQTAWRVFYSNTDGDVTELAFGSNGQYLKSNGASSAPSWAAPAGGGDLLADGSVPLTANWDVGNYDITLKALTGDGTIEGATITEGGNAVYSSGETPGGSLGGTWASPTIDDLFIKLVGDTTGALTEDLNIDADSFVISFDDNMIGIGQSSPTSPLHISTTAKDAADGSGLRIDSSLTSATNPQYGIHSRPTIAPTGASVQDYVSGGFIAVSSSNNVANAGLYGSQSSVYYTGTGTVGTSYGSYLKNYILAAGTLTTSIGLRVCDPGISGGGAVTNNYGIYLEDMNGGGTLNYSIYSIGGAAFWGSSLTAADFYTIEATGAFGDVSVVKIEQKTGNPTDGTLLEIITADAEDDPDHLLLRNGSDDYVTHKIVEAGTYTIDVTSDGTAAVAIPDPITANGGITSSGTIEGATITEGGNAVYNSGETPGGSLGGTWASPTIDDLFIKLGGDVATAGNYDFGGADLELPQATAAAPDADGEIEIDFTDGTVVIQHGSAHAELGASTDVVVGKLIHSFAATIFAPDGVNDVIPLKMIDDLEFPHGVVIVECLLQVGTDSNYTLTLQNYDDFDTINGANGTIDAVAYTAGNNGEVTDTSITYGTIAAGQIIMMSIPNTDVDWCHIEVFYYEPIS